MLNPTDPSRPPARTSRQLNEDRKPPNLTWVRPPRPPLQSGMLQNRKLDLHKSGRATPSRRP
jgi:hypothetical protein